MSTHGYSRVSAIFGLAALMLGGSPVVQADADGVNWAGKYLFESQGAPTASGKIPVATYTLVVADPPQARPAVLTIDAEPARQTIICDARESQGALVLSFRNYGDGRRTNQAGIAEYESGQVLFVLSGNPSARGEGVVTSWKKFVPHGVQDVPGRFFRRIAPKASH